MNLFRALFAPGIALLLAACSETEAVPASPEPLVDVVVPKLRSYHAEQRFIGHLESVEETVIFARTDGALSARHFKEGSDVTEGQPLFTLDQRELEAIVKQRRGELAAAVSASEVSARLYERGRRLITSDHISQTELERLRSNAERAVAEVESATGALDAAEVKLSYTEIAAPFDGRISASKVAHGELVQASATPLATLVSLDPIHVTFHVEEQARTHLSSLNDSAAVAVSLLGRDDKPYKSNGRIIYIDNRIDRHSGTLEIKAVFPNRDHRLLPGERVNVVVTQRTGTEVPTVPQAAVQTNNLGSFIYVLKENSTVERISVQSGPRLGNDVVIVGLNTERRVVVSGHHQLRDGSSVAVRERSHD